MQKIRAGRMAFSALSAKKKAVVLGACALLLALIAALCISISIRSNMQKDYAAVRNRIGDALYSNLNMMVQTFDMTSVPGADVQRIVLPQMRQYYIASTTLNDVLGDAYGQRYRVLSESDSNSITSAFSAYESALSSNSPTDLAQSNLQLCMDRVRELLNSRFSQGVLKAAR